MSGRDPTTSTPFHAAVADQGLVSTSDTGPLGGVRRVTISAVPPSGSPLTTATVIATDPSPVASQCRGTLVLLT